MAARDASPLVSLAWVSPDSSPSPRCCWQICPLKISHHLPIATEKSQTLQLTASWSGPWILLQLTPCMSETALNDSQTASRVYPSPDWGLCICAHIFPWSLMPSSSYSCCIGLIAWERNPMSSCKPYPRKLYSSASSINNSSLCLLLSLVT
jgi:hypothetical protein